MRKSRQADKWPASVRGSLVGGSAIAGSAALNQQLLLSIHLRDCKQGCIMRPPASQPGVEKGKKKKVNLC